MPGARRRDVNMPVPILRQRLPRSRRDRRHRVADGLDEPIDEILLRVLERDRNFQFLISLSILYTVLLGDISVNIVYKADNRI